MKFGVVLCSRCTTARGVRLGAKTATCTQCGKKLNLKKAKILCEVDSVKDVAGAVRQYNTELKGGAEVYARDIRAVEKKQKKLDLAGMGKPQDVYAEVSSKLVTVRARDDKITAAAQELGRHLGEFTQNDFSEVLKRIGIEGEKVSEMYIARLIENNVIYEPKSGLYRCLESN